MLRRGIRRRFSHIVSNLSDPRSGRDSLVTWHCLDQKCSDLSLLPKVPLFTCIRRSYESEVPISRVSCECSPIKTLLSNRSSTFVPRNLHVSWQHVRCMSSSSIELTADKDVVRFSIGKQTERAENPEARRKKLRTSKKAKLNELRLYRLKAKKKMKSPNPEVRIQYKLGKAKRKEEWLIEKLRKYEVPQAPAETYDPEILTEEEKFYLKRTGEKKKHYVPVGRRGVFGGVVLNMHLHWKNHETVKVVCKPCKPGQIHTYADELARLSKGIVIDIKPNNTILFYRGKNYVQPEIMLPQVTLSKAKVLRITCDSVIVADANPSPRFTFLGKLDMGNAEDVVREQQQHYPSAAKAPIYGGAMEKYRFEQSLEHTSNFIEKLEKELEEYCNYKARFRQEKENATQSSTNNA